MRTTSRMCSAPRVSLVVPCVSTVVERRLAAAGRCLDQNAHWSSFLYGSIVLLRTCAVGHKYSVRRRWQDICSCWTKAVHSAMPVLHETNMHDVCQAPCGGLARGDPLRDHDQNPQRSVRQARSQPAVDPAGVTVRIGSGNCSGRSQCLLTPAIADVRLRQPRQGSTRRRELGAALARIVSRQRSARHARRAPRRRSAALSSRRPSARRSASKRYSSLDSHCGATAPEPDRRSTRARQPQLQDREPALVGAVRPDAGIPLAYNAFAREVRTACAKPEVAAAGPELLGRQIVHMGLDAKIRLYRYEQWIPAKWAELHALFSLACSRQIDRAQLLLGAAAPPPPRSSTNTCWRCCCS